MPRSGTPSAAVRPRSRPLTCGVALTLSPLPPLLPGPTLPRPSQGYYVTAAPYPGTAAAAAPGMAGVAGAPAGPPAYTMIYDPSAPANVDKMNAAYMQRHMPMLTGAFMRFGI